jgi:hypothetical protein
VPERPAVEVTGSVGGNVVGGDLTTNTTAGRDVVGRDVVTTTTTTTTNVGFSAAAVQRLLLTVGLLVFATAACFFSGGVFVGLGAITALNTDVASDDPVAAAEFAELLALAQALPPGTIARLTFTEQQISAYFRQVVAPGLPMNITDGKIRLLDSRRLVVGGRLGDLGGRPFAATFTWQESPSTPLRLTAAALQVLPAGESPFGWVAIPTVLLAPVEQGINQLFAGLILTDVDAGPGEDTWDVTIVGR